MYAKATKHPHGYVFIDLRQETDDEMRIRSRVLQKHFPMHVYKQEKRFFRLSCSSINHAYVPFYHYFPIVKKW